MGSDWFTDNYEELDSDAPDRFLGLTSSPDGNKIAFVPRFDSEGKSDTNLWIMNTATKRITKAHIPGLCYYPSWSAHGDKILFETITSKGFNICTINEDGGEFNVWTKSFNAMNHKAQWSPNSQNIGFVKNFYLPFVKEIWLIDLNRNMANRVVKGSFCNLISSRVFRTWFLSKEGKVFYWDCSGDDKETLGLYGVSPENPGEVESFQPFDLDTGHIWMAPAPGGHKLAYINDNGDLSTLFIYDFDTGKIREYELCQLGNQMWAPDGNNFVYQEIMPGPEDRIHLLSVETGESKVLASGALPGKAFGPGGKSIYYEKWGEKNDRPSIWRINLDGTNDTKIFPVEGIEHTNVHPVPVLKWAERN